MTRRSGGHQASIGLNAAQGPLVATYQTRISDYGDMDRLEGAAALSAYAELYGRCSVSCLPTLRRTGRRHR